jgi:hypothetical protein
MIFRITRFFLAAAHKNSQLYDLKDFGRPLDNTRKPKKSPLRERAKSISKEET